ncbi:MAG: tRNA (adenosine(37)-N6)-threonylcarbamoyltransferase complex dimerization subunit type 1 TsaB [Thermoanaerobacteraceae bacterium]|nr:tRNA (adenosine(37)-N6)-threonylcarbamoyltransferase complex dimerization subunit type 1 TsaB [Thermoanaerobacteraceae bacterium]
MRILGIDTSTSVGSAAVVEDDRILGEFYIESNMTHSVKFMPMMGELLNTLDIGMEDMDAVAVTIGPGSFTGLRIGLAHAKAICHALDKPIVGINTLDALAYNMFNMRRTVCPMLDARNEQVYTAIYEDGKRVSEYMGISIHDLIHELRGRDVIISGDGARRYAEVFRDNLPDVILAPAYLMMPRASSIAMLGIEKLKAGEEDNLYKIAPFYMRKPQAERLRELRK